jgi:hypothetical protein
MFYTNKHNHEKDIPEFCFALEIFPEIINNKFFLYTDCLISFLNKILLLIKFYNKVNENTSSIAFICLDNAGLVSITDNLRFQIPTK